MQLRQEPLSSPHQLRTTLTTLIQVTSETPGNYLNRYLLLITGKSVEMMACSEHGQAAQPSGPVGLAEDQYISRSSSQVRSPSHTSARLILKCIHLYPETIF